jgi:hypothetical protein
VLKVALPSRIFRETHILFKGCGEGRGMKRLICSRRRRRKKKIIIGKKR